MKKKVKKDEFKIRFHDYQDWPCLTVTGRDGTGCTIPFPPNTTNESISEGQIVDLVHKAKAKLGCFEEKFVKNRVDNGLRLYSLNKARQLLRIGRTTLDNFINAGLIGIVPPAPGSKFSKIPHSEIEKFLSEQTVREQKLQFTANFTNRDVNEFINGNKSRRNDMKDFDSTKLFDQLLEQHNGKRI